MFCEQCGAKIGDGAQFCEGCGAPVAVATYKPSQPLTTAFEERPTIVFILVFLLGIQAVLDILAGIVLTVAGRSLEQASWGMQAGAVTLGGFVAEGLGIFSAVLAYKLWKLKRWAWKASVVLLALAVLFSLFLLFQAPISSLIGMVLGVTILYFLFKAENSFQY